MTTSTITPPEDLRNIPTGELVDSIHRRLSRVIGVNTLLEAVATSSGTLDYVAGSEDGPLWSIFADITDKCKAVQDFTEELIMRLYRATHRTQKVTCTAICDDAQEVFPWIKDLLLAVNSGERHLVKASLSLALSQMEREKATDD